MYYDKKRDLYVYRISDGFDSEGRSRRIAFSGKTQEAALEKYREWKRRGSFASVDPAITLAEWGIVWLDEYKTKVEESTAAGYEYTLQLIVKSFLGRLKVKDIDASHIEEYLDRMAVQYSSSQCGKLRAMLGQILRKAQARHLIAENPVPLADKTNYRRLGKKTSSKKDAFTAAEVAALMIGLPDTRIGHSIRLMIGSGMSTQELLGLWPSEIAPDGSRLSINRAVKIKKGGGMYIGDVKAEHRDREVILPPSVRASALFLRNTDRKYVIASRTSGMPMHPTTYRDFYKSAVRSVKGVRLLTPHCCRHTYISHLQDRGVDFAVIQALAGQSERSSTIQYIHPQSPSISAAVGAIEALLSGENSVPINVPTDAPEARMPPEK
jgi:integrase